MFDSPPAVNIKHLVARDKISESESKTLQNWGYFMCTICGQRDSFPYALYQKRGLYILQLLFKSFMLRSSWFFCLSGNLFLRWSNFHLV